jgi:DMSO/TMAO reductase YedYZ molybdopterin-dependent catalytic subunit
MEKVVSEQAPKRLGRGLFLVTVAGGLSSLWWGKSLTKAVSAIPFAPGGGWRIYTVAPTMPTFDPATWRLDVGGLVDKPMTVTYDELRAMPATSQIRDFHCVTGWTVSNVHWKGVRLSELLDRVHPQFSALGVQFTSAEIPYVDSLSIFQAKLPDVLLAYEMNGKPLPREHGAPVRLVIPEMYGYKNVKWVSRIDLVEKAQDGYWENLGYDRDAYVGHSNGL